MVLKRHREAGRLQGHARMDFRPGRRVARALRHRAFPARAWVTAGGRPIGEILKI